MIQQGNYGRLLEPGLRKIFMETYKEVPEQFSQVFKVQTSNKAIETDLRIGGFGEWDVKASAGATKYQDPTGTAAIQYIHEEYSNGFTVERKMIDDEQYNTIGKFSANLARGARATIERKAAAILNNAFTVNGFDGASLVSRTHKRLDGGTLNNQLDANYGAGGNDGALSDRNLKAALIQAADQRDDHGILIQVQPKLLVVPRALYYKAKTILESMNLSATGTGSAMTNDKNVLEGGLKIVVMDYLNAAQGGSDTQWFVIDPTTADLNFFWRKKLEFKNEHDFDTDQAKYKGYMRFSVGYSDFRGLVGSLGTGAA